MSKTATLSEENNASVSSHVIPSMDESAIKSKSKKSILIMVGVLGIFLVAVVSYFVFNMVSTPAQVKEKSQLVEPVFVDLCRTIKKIGEHVKESSGSDSDSMERYAQKGKSLLKDAQRDRATLQTHIDTMTVSALSKYKDTLTAYLKEADSLIETEKDNISAGEAYVEPLRQ